MRQRNVRSDMVDQEKNQRLNINTSNILQVRMLEFDFIRHPECDENLRYHERIGGRSTHSPITQRGYRQLEALMSRLQQEGVRYERIFASPATRTLVAAKYIAHGLGYPEDKIVIDHRLQELDAGAWEHWAFDEVYTRETLRMMRMDNWHFAPPNGESQRQVEDRTLRWLMETITFADRPAHDKPAHRYVVLSHGLATKCMLRGILDFPPRFTYDLSMYQTGITTLRYETSGFTVLRYNDHEHLNAMEEENGKQARSGLLVPSIVDFLQG
jgi:broad specificity phosphatase PhoE